ncbi:MAG TPA: NAD-dependent epimerase/dehydratase family protein [Polyangia bacterium]|nr:NAD-dependent epimerase/dehydratase family protein [Polyangia bacterium]
MPKVLVTGGSGFLGSHLVRELCRRGEAGDLRVLAQSAPPPWMRALPIEIAAGSVTSAADMTRAMEGVDRVYHLAGLVSPKPADAHRMYDVHVNGTRTLCEAAARAGVKRIVMASTSGTVAVSTRADELPDETSPAPVDIIARWPYYASKLYQEEAARRACAHKIELVMLNPSLLLGPGDDRLSSTRVVLSFLAREIPLIPPGGLNFVDVRDVAALFPVAMERATAGERYLVGGYNWPFDEFLGRLERLSKVTGPKLKARGKLPLLATRAQAALYRHWGRTPPVEPQSLAQSEHFWYFESGKAARELGFIPRDATDTLFDTVKYVRENFLGNDALTRKPAGGDDGGGSSARRAIAEG